jgi:hypothetical protein
VIAMVKMLILAVWVSAITALSSMAVSEWRLSHVATARSDAADRNYEYRKTRVINVPVIAEGSLLGYVLIQLVYAIDVNAAEKLSVNPEAIVLDYVFRTLYGDPKLDFRHLDKYDIVGLTKQIPIAMNEKLGVGMVRDVLIQDFSYMPKDQAPK